MFYYLCFFFLTLSILPPLGETFSVVEMHYAFSLWPSPQTPRLRRSWRFPFPLDSDVMFIV